ncbi:MAG: hypothetical protein ABIN89_18525 [Chitinophagaceae bacterium]
MLHFATYFDSNYLTRGLALLHSLKQHTKNPFTLYILALDKQVIIYFQKKNDINVVTINIDDLEDHFPELAEAKKNRSTVEYYFTLSPFLPSYILEKFDDIDQVTTMDADLYFFDDPALILESYPHASILITPHNFSPEMQYLEIYGNYNVSFQSFKNNGEGWACLRDWKQKCLEWCHDYLDEINHRFADQKYLDSWKGRFDVRDIDIPGAGLAPWNIEKYNYSLRGKKVFVNGLPLIYFHFHHLRIFKGNFAVNGLRDYKVDVSQKAVKIIYHTYLKRLASLSNINVVSDNNIERDVYKTGKSFMQRINDKNGYWFFTSYFIIHLNLSQPIQKIKRTLKYLLPG